MFHRTFTAVVALWLLGTLPIVAQKPAAEPVKLLDDTLRHTDTIYAVAFSPDGKFLAVGGGNYSSKAKLRSTGELTLWDTATRNKVATLDGHTKPLWYVVFSPDGRLLATSAADQTLRLWDVATGKQVANLSADLGSPSQVAFSPDGKTLAEAVWVPAKGAGPPTPGFVRLWDVQTRKIRGKLEGFPGEVHGLAFSPNGDTLATGTAKWDEKKECSVDAEILFWDLPTAKLLGKIDARQSAITGLAFSPDGKSLATGSPPDADADGKNTWGTIKLWDIAGQRLRMSAKVHEGPVKALAMSADGKFIVSQGCGYLEIQPAFGFATSILLPGELVLLDGRNLKRLWTRPTGDAIHGVVAFSPKDLTLAVGEGSSVSLWAVSGRP